VADTPSDAPIPPPLPEDPEDVSWALSTAGAMWSRGDLVEALKWLRRGAEAASEAEHDDRALQLAKIAADLTGRLGVGASSPPPAPRPSVPIPAAKPATVAPTRPTSPPPKASSAPLRPSVAPRPAAALLVRGTPRGGAARPGESRSDSAPPRSVRPSGPPSAKRGAMPVPSSALESGRFRTQPPARGRLEVAVDEAVAQAAVDEPRRGPPPLPRTDDDPADARENTFSSPDDDDDTCERRVEDIWPPTRVEAPQPMSSGRELAATPAGEVAPEAPGIASLGAMRPPASSATDWDALPTRARLEALALAPPATPSVEDDEDSGTNPSQDPHSAAGASVATPTPSRPGSPALVTSQAVRVVLWKDANGVHVAPQGTLVRAITIEAMLVALDPSADLGAWLDPVRPKG